MSFLTKLSVGFAKLDAIHRLLIALCCAVPCYFFFIWLGIKPVTALMMSWDVFSLLMIITIWTIFFNIPDSKINVLAQREDESRTVILFIVVISLLVSLFGIVILLKNTSEKWINPSMHESVSLISVALSWIMLHT